MVGRAEAEGVAPSTTGAASDHLAVIGGPFHTTVASLSSSVSCGKTRSTGGWVTPALPLPALACLPAIPPWAVTGPVTGRDPVVAPPAADMVAGPS